MGGQPSDAPALSPPSPLQQGGQSSNAPALSPPSPLPQGGQPIALALSPPSPPPQGGQPSDAPGLSPSSSTLLLCPSDSTLNICHLNSQSAVKTGLVRKMDHPAEDWEGKIEIDVAEDPDPPGWTQGLVRKIDHPEEDWEGKIEIDVAEDPDAPGWTQGQGSGASSDVIKTEPITANICSDVIKTEPITADISSDVIKTEPITADISSDVIKTEPITANISSDVIKTEPITADISSDVIKTEPITADISSDVIKTEPITANICSDVIKTEPVTACTCSDVIKTEPITTNISSDVIKTESITANISSDVIKTEPITADISSDVIKTEPITANISSNVIKTEPVTASPCSDVIKTEPITANISSDVIKTEPITADISSDVIKTEPITEDISTPESITSEQRGVDTQTGDKQQSIEVCQVIQDKSHLVPAVYRGQSEGHSRQVTYSSSLSRSVRSSKTGHISFQQSIKVFQKVIQDRSHLIPAVYRGRSEGHPRHVTSLSSSLSRSVRSSKTGHISFQQSIEVGQKVIQDRTHLIPAVYRGRSEGHPGQVTSHSSSLSRSVRRSSRSLLCGIAVPSPDGRKSSIRSRTSAVSEEDDLPNDEHADNTGDGESGGIPVWLTGKEDDEGDDEGDDDEGDVDEGDDDEGDDDEGVVEGEDELQSGLSYACLFGLCGTRSLPYPVFCRHGQGGTEHPAPRVSEGTVRFGAPTWLSLPVTRRNLARIHLSVGRVAEPAVGRKGLVDRGRGRERLRQR
ncbi:hypothetical protein ACOMHN_005609 [Nucella lapillus]